MQFSVVFGNPQALVLSIGEVDLDKNKEILLWFKCYGMI